MYTQRIEDTGYEVARSFECAWPIQGLLFSRLIRSAASLAAISARKAIPGYNGYEVTPEMQRLQLSHYLAAIADKFAEFCDPENSMYAKLPAKDEKTIQGLLTPEVAASFRIHMEAAQELVKRPGLRWEALGEQAKRLSLERIIDSALGPAGAQLPRPAEPRAP